MYAIPRDQLEKLPKLQDEDHEHFRKGHPFLPVSDDDDDGYCLWNLTQPQLDDFLEGYLNAGRQWKAVFP
jgi:hypothetical protein